MLLRVGIESPKELRGGCLLQLDRGDKPQNLIPLGLNEGFFDVAIREEFIALLFLLAPFAEAIELLAFERFDTRGKREPQ